MHNERYADSAQARQWDREPEARKQQPHLRLVKSGPIEVDEWAPLTPAQLAANQAANELQAQRSRAVIKGALAKMEARFGTG